MSDVPGIILAAGLSRRMGQPKVLLPWGDTSVLGAVVETLTQAGLTEILVVTGAQRERVETEVARLAEGLPVRAVFNSQFERGEMLSSIQVGLTALAISGRAPLSRDETTRAAALIALGDQPQIQTETVREILRALAGSRVGLVVPSFNHHRGHPWLISSALWDELLALRPPATARDFLERHRAEIDYVTTVTPTILQDMDSPADYERDRPS
jgi:molybdenum cofactor cytidylyltransferase